MNAKVPPPYPLPTARKPYTPEQVRKFFMAAGMPISSWAEAHGYSRHQVYLTIGGQFKGTRGRCHEIALELGLKLSVDQLAA